MAAFPNSSVCLTGFPQGEEPGTVVERTEMERGVAKQRRIASDANVQADVIVYFTAKANIATWETWFYTTIHAGQDWFDWTDSRTGATLQARIVGGNPGKLVPSTKTWAYAQRTLRLEWMRSAL